MMISLRVQISEASQLSWSRSVTGHVTATLWSLSSLYARYLWTRITFQANWLR